MKKFYTEIDVILTQDQLSTQWFFPTLVSTPEVIFKELNTLPSKIVVQGLQGNTLLFLRVLALKGVWEFVHGKPTLPGGFESSPKQAVPYPFLPQ